MIDTTVGSKSAPDGDGTRPRASRAVRPTITIVLPSGWGRSAAVGIGAALVGWFVPILVASLGFWLVADNPWLQDVTWQDAVTMGSGFWSLSLGGSAALGAVAVTLIPLLWSLVQVFVVRLLLQVLRQYSAAAAWAVVPFFTLTALILALTLGHASWPRVLIGAVVISGLGALWAYLSLAQSYPAWMSRLDSAWQGLRIGSIWLAVLVAMTLVVVGLAWWREHQVIADAARAMGATGANGAVLGLLQLSYAPTIAAWAFAWLLGVGFVGVGGVVVGPPSPPAEALPLPVWHIVPDQVVQLPAWPWPIVFCGLALGLGAGWLLRRRSAAQAAVAASCAALSFLMFAAAWMALSRGALGDNHLSLLGPSTGAVTVRLLGTVIVPALVGVVAMHPETLRLLVSLWRRVQEWFRGRFGDHGAMVESSPEVDQASPVASQAAADATDGGEHDAE